MLDYDVQINQTLRYAEENRQNFNLETVILILKESNKMQNAAMVSYPNNLPDINEATELDVFSLIILSLYKLNQWQNAPGLISSILLTFP